nr:glycine zipper 2TM domain-containing protein [Bordetella genomosp. 8]
MAARRGLHPLVAIASVCVIALCAVATAAIMGWLPTPKAQQEGRDQTASVAQGPEDANLAPLPAGQGQPAAQAAASASGRAAAASTPQRVAQAPATQPPSSQQQAAAACPQCGVVVSINTVQVPAQNNGEPIVGTVAGGVVGGVVGNQFGGGHGRTALTVLGAVGGALAGREIERNIKQQQTVTRYQLVARTNDGRTHTFHSATPFQYSPGQAIRVENNQLLPG